MRLARFILFGMLLLSIVAVNFIAPAPADGPRGTRSPGAAVEVTAVTQNQSGIPTETITYIFDVNNTGDENDTFDIFVDSENNWPLNVTHAILGPLVVNQTASVIVNTTIPMGWPDGTWDNITLRARSNNDFGISDIASVTTNVSAMFIVSIDINNGFESIGLIDEENQANYTLTIKNMGNVDVTITLDHTSPSLPGWHISFPDYPNKKVAISKANLSGESVFEVNVTVGAPNNAQPDDMVTIELWAEKTDISPEWYSWQSQENITLITTVQPVLDITFEPEEFTGYADINDTTYNFTITNSGNKVVVVDLVAKTDLLLDPTIANPHMTVPVGTTTDVNILRISTAKNTPLGNYTINLTALDSSNSALVGFIELYYIVVPKLNITDISISSDEPIQYKDITLSATIENIGYVDAANVTVKFFDGSKKINKATILFINATQTATAKIRWSPSDFGNRSIRVELSVEGTGNFSEHGEAISEKTTNFEVKINWQPYYLMIYIIIVVVLAIGVVSGLMELRYYSGVPHVNSYGEDGEGGEYDDYPEEEEEPQYALEEGEEKRPFGTYGVTTDSREHIDDNHKYEYEKLPEREYRAPPPPAPEPQPPRQEFAPPVDPETKRVEFGLRDEIAKVQDELDKTKTQGVDTSKIDQLLDTARRNLSDGDSAKTKQYIGYASERLNNLKEKREEAVRAIKEAREVLSSMGGSADLTIVENFLVKADSLLKEGDYREAINYAKKAKDRAQRLQRKEMRL